MRANAALRCALFLCLSSLLLVACVGPEDGASTGTGGTGGATTTTTSTKTHTTTTTTTTTTTSEGGTGGDPGWGGGGIMDDNLAAHAGDDAEFFRGDIGYLYGSYTAAPGTQDIEVLWEQISGETVDLQIPSATSPSFVTPDVVGPLVFRMHVRSEWGWGTPDDVTIQIQDRAPTVSAGPDVGVPGGTKVTLAGTAMDADDKKLTYAWTQVSGPDVPLSGADTLTPALTIPADLNQPLVYALTANDGLKTSDPDWVTLVRIEGPDADGDLLEDKVEAQLGTDPQNPDTDADGIPDGWEVMGHEQVDYPGVGCDPRHRDLLVELDYQQYTDANGQLRSAHPSPAVESALQAFYDGLDVDNPDGLPGMHLRFFDDTVLGADFRCVFGGPFPAWADTSPSNFLYREAFHRVQICVQPDSGGVAEIGGRAFTMAFNELDADPSNDLEEGAALYLYAIFVHEMGHNFDLHHGGDQDLNYKPTYPSLMNYAYTFTLNGSPKTIKDTKIAFSRGVVPTVDECALVEQSIFSGVAPADIEFLATYGNGGWTADASGSVDWNHDGALSDTPYSLVLRSPLGLGDPPSCVSLHDHDDLAVIAKRMGHALPASPAPPGGANAIFKSRKRPVLAP